MHKPLRVLLVEDSDDLAQSLVRELQRTGYKVDFERVATAKAMQALLTEKTWDVILSDYTLTRFGAMQALEVLNAQRLDLPFLVILGTRGEETAVAVRKAGTNDFILKGTFPDMRLLIEHELHEAELRHEYRQVEPEAQSSEKRFEAAFDLSPVGICITGLDGRLTNISPSFLDMLGYTAAELIGKHFNDITHPDDLEIGKEAIGRMISGQIPGASFEKRYLHKNGEPIWTLVSSSLQRDTYGKPVHFITYILSMTERRQAQKQLKFYASILESANDAIIGKDLEGIIVSWNQGAEKLYGYTPKEVIGKSLMLIIPPDRPHELASILESIKKGQRIERFETVRLAKDGRRIDISLIVSPILDDEGHVQGASSIGHDIAERKRAESQTAQLKRLYATLSQLNQAIVRIHKREQLYQAICDIAVHFGGFALAWIGILDESTGDVHPRVVKGMEMDHWPFPLANIHQGPLVNGLVATAIRTARVAISGDIQSDARTQRLQEQSRIANFHSAAAIPFALRGRIIGTLNLLSHETDFFSAEEEANLLNEIGLNVSFGLDTIETETERQLAEAKLRESEQKFSLLFEKSSLAISLSRLPDGIIVDVNEAFERVFGYTKQEAIGKTSLELGINPDAAGRARLLAVLNEQGSARNEELVLLTRSGEARTFSVNIDFVEIGGQNYILNTTLDITERKRGEEKIAFQSYLLENITDAVLATDAQFRLTSWNHAAEDMYGYRADEVLGHNAQEIIRSEFSDAERAIAIKALRETGLYHNDIIQYHRDGHSFWVDGGTFALKQPDGQIYGFVSINHDITERKQAEERFRLIVESAPNAMVLVDREGSVEMVNSQTEIFFGYDRSELIGLNVDRLVPDRLRALHRDHRQGYISEPQARSMGVGRDLYGVRKDGSEFPVEIGLTPIVTQEGLLVMATIVDITQRKRAEEELMRTSEELRRSNTELEQFAYVSSHDLQEPLRMVSSYVQLLAKRYKGKLDQDADDFIGFAVEGATRMQQLINDLLAYSRAGTQAKPFTPTDFEAVLENTLANLQIAIEDSQATITHDPLPTLMADPVQMGQLLQNLIGNAIKFRDQSPRIHIHAERVEKSWLFSVRDNGLGIDPQFFERIFIIFQRLHTRAEYAGTGIGLAICKKIVERHGGRIWVEAAPEQGSIFQFTIPDAGGQHESKSQTD